MRYAIALLPSAICTPLVNDRTRVPVLFTGKDRTGRTFSVHMENG